MSVLLSFLWVHCILLHEYTTFGLSLQLMDIVCGFHFLAVLDKAALNFCVQVLSECLISVLLGIALGVELPVIW